VDEVRYRLIHQSRRRLLVVGSVRRIIGGFYLREPLNADGVDLGDPVLEGGPFDLILHLAMPQSAFQGDELPLLEGFEVEGIVVQSNRTCRCPSLAFAPPQLREFG
jgi:hypothetical protein